MRDSNVYGGLGTYVAHCHKVENIILNLKIYIWNKILSNLKVSYFGINRWQLESLLLLNCQLNNC